MEKLLIVEPSDGVVKILVDALQDEWDITVCPDLDSAPEILSSLQPDALIFDASFPYQQALNFLSNCLPVLPSSVVAISASMPEYFSERLIRQGADHAFEIPTDLYLIKYTLGSLEELRSRAAKRLIHHLRYLGFSGNHNGYFALLLAIPYMKNDFTLHLHKEVYPYVAQRLRSDPRSIEHSIRTAIQAAWNHRTNEKWAHYFPTNENGEVECPKNKAFLVSLAQRI